MRSAPAWVALDDALDRALDLEGLERESFLTTLDSATREAVAALLRDALRDDSVLDHPEAVLAALRENADDDGPDEGRIIEGVRVGPYQIEALIGEGGMGRVFRAHRADGAFDQTVAVKVVRKTLSLAGSDVADRFRRERDMLASLDHPGIARLLDAGRTDDGVPYLVTEFIDGAAITTWAEEHALDVKARVRLMMEVASAIDHAHRRFIVHRDLKPSNVLVTARDGLARPVVLDFGIAKLLDDAESEGTDGCSLTRTGFRLLTPAYAAPELFDPTATVTTAADVYGLGALLYELLTGHRPHDGTDGAGPPSTEVKRPSKVVMRSDTAAAFEPLKRARALQGDLDTICLKALHSDPSRRYISAVAFAEDLTRYLDGRPVDARPDSLAYVVGRFVRRHRAVALAATVAVLALVGGLTTSLVLLGQEREARAEAETAVARATEAADLLAGLFQNANPTSDGKPVTVRDALDEGLARIAAVESDSLRAYLFGVLGVTYIKLSELQRADSLLALSLALYGDNASGARISELRISYAATRDGFADHETALALGRRVYDDLGGSGSTSSLAVRALCVMSKSHLALGQPREGLQRAMEAVVLARGEDLHDRVPQALSSLGNAFSALERYDEAIRAHQEAVRGYEEVYGPEEIVTSGARAALGAALNAAGSYAEAEAVFRDLEAFQTRVFGPSVSLVYTLASIGSVKLNQGRYREAAAVLDSAVTMGRNFLPPEHPDRWRWLTALAVAKNRSGAYRSAEAAAREALTSAEGASDVIYTGRALAQLGLALDGMGRTDEAHAILQRATLALEAPEVRAEVEAEDIAAVRAALANASEGL